MKQSKKQAILKWKAEGEEKKVEEGIQYRYNHWEGAKRRLEKEEGVIGSSTEGHVSHVLAERMSSRPMGWSKKGTDQMAKLRAYAQNGVLSQL